jgi:hypothetical protein
LLVGQDIAAPVSEEYQTALAHSKWLLVFLKDVEHSPAAEAFVEEIKVKWATFRKATELQCQVLKAVGDEQASACARVELHKAQGAEPW